VAADGLDERADVREGLFTQYVVQLGMQLGAAGT